MANLNAFTSLRSMLAAIEQWKNPQTFVLDTFFKEENISRTKHVEIDFYDEQRRIAPFQLRSASGTLVNKEGYDKFIFTPPCLKPTMDIDPEDLEETMIGETVYDTQSDEMRLATLIAKNLKILDNMIWRTEERMAIQAILEREIEIRDEKNNLIDTIEIDGIASGQDFNASAYWNTTSDPLKDIDAAGDLIEKNSGLYGDAVLMGSTASRAFINNDDVLKKFDLFRGNFGQIEYDRAAAFGIKYLGYIEGRNFYQIAEWFKDPADGVTKALFDPKKVVVGSTMGRQIRHYGRPHTLQSNARVRRLPRYFDPAQRDPEIAGIQLQSCPLPMTHQPNAFSVIQAIAA